MESGWPCNTALGWGPPKSNNCGIHGEHTPSAAFMSSFFHVQLHLMDRNKQPCQVNSQGTCKEAPRTPNGVVAWAQPGIKEKGEVGGALCQAFLGSLPLALPTSSLARPQQTLNKAYPVPMQLTFNMSDVMVFRGISRGSCMWTSCSSARIQGKS